MRGKGILNMERQAPESSVPNIAGKVLTVNGTMDPGELGPTIMHEHIFIDFWKDKVPPHNTPATDAALWDQKLALDNLHLALRRNHIKDNHVLGDEDTALAEVMEFKKNGGSTIVDVTSIGLGRDPHALRRVANGTGLKVIMGSGWYKKTYHPDDMDQRTVEDMAEEIVRDVTRGVGDTGIRSGIIGEVGIDGNPLTPNEIKSLQAAARASRATGAAISLHRGGQGREKLQTISVLEEAGADLSRVIFGHSDRIAWDMPLMLEILGHGVYMQFDTLGKDVTSLFLRPAQGDTEVTPSLATTPQVIEAIPNLIEQGYGGRILLSHDVCHKNDLKGYGGNGYSFVLERVLPTLRSKGVTEEQITGLIVDNPRRVLAFAEPQ